MTASTASRAKLLAPLLLVLWFATLAFPYHSNFPPGTLPSHVLTLFLAALLLAGATALGAGILDRLAPGGLKAPLSWALAMGLGLGVLDLLMLGLFALGLARPPVAWTLAAVLAALIATRIAAWRREAAEAGAIWKETATRFWVRAGGAAALLGLGVALLAALAPAEFYDALIYHLAVPARFIADGGLVPIEGNFYASFPSNQSMLYALGMLLAGDAVRAGSLAQVLHWGCGVAALAATYGAGARHVGAKTGWLAALLLATAPGILLTSTWAIADLGVMLDGSLVLACLLEASDAAPAARRRYTLLAGIFAGLALGVKYTAALSVLAPGLALTLFMAWRGRRDGGARGRLADAAIFALAAAAIFAPWAVRNAVLAGNPVAPYLGGLFGAETSARTIGEELSRRIPAGTGATEALLFHLGAFWRAGVSRLGAGGYLGVTFALLIPFVLFRRRHPSAIPALAVYAGAGLAAWSAGVEVSRYLFPVLPAAALLAAHGALCLVRAAPATYEGLACVLAWLIGHGLYLFAVLTLTSNPFGAVLGIEPVDEYLSRRVEYYSAAEFINAGLPEGARVLFVGEGRGYYVERAYEASTPLDRILIEKLASRAVRERRSLAEVLRNAGFTHLLRNRREMDRAAAMAGRASFLADADPEVRAAVDALFDGDALKVVHRSGGVEVFEIAAR